MCKYREYLGVVRSVNYRQRRLIYGDDVSTQFVIDRGVILALAIKFSWQYLYINFRHEYSPYLVSGCRSVEPLGKFRVITQLVLIRFW